MRSALTDPCRSLLSVNGFIYSWLNTLRRKFVLATKFMKNFLSIFTFFLVLGCCTHAYAQDTTRPTVTITAPAAVKTDSFDETITFSENVNGFAAGDLTASGGNAMVIVKTSNNPVFVVTVTVDEDFEGTVFLEVGANVVEDDDNNGNEVSASKATHVDKTAPTVTFRVEPDKDAQNAVFSLFVTFNETVTGFDANNVT